MSRKLLTIYTRDNKGKAVISVGGNETFFIDYYDDIDNHFFCEEFSNIKYEDVEYKASAWAEGRRKLEEKIL
jgi:hypothetical protein